MNWIAFAEAFPVNPEAALEVLTKLNEELSNKAILLGNGLKPSEADIIVFSVIHSSLVCIVIFTILSMISEHKTVPSPMHKTIGWSDIYLFIYFFL